MWENGTFDLLNEMANVLLQLGLKLFFAFQSNYTAYFDIEVVYLTFITKMKISLAKKLWEKKLCTRGYLTGRLEETSYKQGWHISFIYYMKNNNQFVFVFFICYKKSSKKGRKWFKYLIGDDLRIR